MICGSCGADNPAASRFCNSCGHPLITRADERRVATVVFADLVGFTTLSETRDPEQIKNLVDRCFARLAQDVTAFGGQVDKIMGDALIALFGAPLAHEDDAERAVRAALRMQESLASFQQNAEIVVQMRVGVNTGEVLVGSLRAGGEYTAMGDVVNTAQRLQASATPGTVVVGPQTYLATRDAIQYQPLGDLQAKGREEPVQAWIAVEPLLPPGYRRRRQETPFVGRDPEVGVLSHATDAAVARDRAHFVLLVGDAGVGKSRLAEEASCRARTKHGARVLEGRCVPYGEANVWWPVAEALRHACDIKADETLAEADRLASEAVADALGMDVRAAEVKRVVNGLLHLMGYEVSLRDIDPQRAREEATRSFLAFVEALARTQPVVLVLSDLHWADDLVLETMNALLDRLRGCPFVLVATSRQELHDRWVVPAGRHNTIIVNLDPLDRDSTRALLDSLVEQEVPADLREALLDRSGGNPFFLEELVALLADADNVPMRGVAGDGSLTHLPDTLRGLVSARLDSLPFPERTMLDDAAVWGRSGPIAALERMAEQVHGLQDHQATLHALEDKEILHLSGDRWSFHSDLIREVAYATLTKADRARRHSGIAYFLAATQPPRNEASDRTVGVVAYHFGAAAELLSELGHVEGVKGDVRTYALDWIEEAAHRAEIGQALPVSTRLYTQALRIVGPEDRVRRVTYLLGRASAETDLRLLAQAGMDIGEAMDLASSMEDPLLAAEALLARGEFEQKAGELHAAVDTIGAAVEAFRALGDLKGIAGALRVLGMTQIFLGEHDAADASIASALEASRELGDRRGVAWALQNLAWISYIEGRSSEAEARLNESAATFQELGDSGGLSWALGLLAFVRFHQGHLAEAEQLGERILVEARERGDRWGEGMMLLLMSGVRLWSGRASEAVTSASDALTLFEGINDRFGVAQAVATVGRAMVTSGRVDEGLHLLQTAIDAHPVLLESEDQDQQRMMLGIGLAGSAVQIGDVHLARDVIDTSSDMLEPRTIGHGDVMVADALNLLQRGRVEAAVERVLPVIDLDGDGQPSPYAQSVLALALAAAGQRDEVLALTDQVVAATRATYLDRMNARLAAALVGGRDHDPAALDALVALEADLAAIDDPVAQAVVALAHARVVEHNGWSGHERAAEQADRRLDALGITATGWRTLFDTALAAPARDAASATRD